jgi:hypothetical protein
MVAFIKDEPTVIIETPADAVKALRKIQDAVSRWIKQEAPTYPIDHAMTFTQLNIELSATIRNFERNIETDPEF